MTPERAVQLAEENGCKMYPTGASKLPGRYVIEQADNPDNFHYITHSEIQECSEEKFRHFYVLEPR